MTTAHLVCVDDLSVVFGSRAVLRGVSFAVRPNEVHGLTGASGAGKTTLLKVIAGAVPPAEGSVCRRRAPHVVGYAPQNAALLPWRTALHNALLGVEVAGGDVAAAERECRADFAAFGLAGFENSYPSQLSGGMGQRIALIRALASHSSLLLLDEPFNGSDFAVKNRLLRRIRAYIERDERGAVLVSHDLYDLARTADRVSVLGGQPARIVREVTLRRRGRDDPFTSSVSDHVAQLAEAVERALEVTDCDE